MGQFDTPYQAASAALAALDAAAEQQYSADQQSIASLQQTAATLQAQITSLQAALATAQAADASDQQKITALTAQIQQLSAQLVSLQGVRIFDALEYGPWGINFKPEVGGSGLGTAHFIPPGVECADFSLAPNPPAAGASNYFDCYFSRHLGTTFSAYKNFKAELSFLFPAAADAAAAQALEWESPRQLVAGKAFIAAMQIEFTGKGLRYWNPLSQWTPTGIPLSRLSPGAWNRFALETHRDDSTLYYDAITINGQRYPLNLTAPFKALPWPDDVKFAIQLDGNGAGTPYRVKVDNVRLSIS